MNTTETPADAAFEPMLELEMEMATFTADWLNCDQCSTYVAGMVSQDRHDPIRHANVLSSALNELLEMSFHTRERDGAFVCRFYRRDETERIELTFPCSPEKSRFYDTVVMGLKSDEVLANYLDVITTGAAPAEHAILLGLAVNYDADITLFYRDTGMLTFVVDLPLERLLN